MFLRRIDMRASSYLAIVASIALAAVWIGCAPPPGVDQQEGDNPTESNLDENEAGTSSDSSTTVHSTVVDAGSGVHDSGGGSYPAYDAGGGGGDPSACDPKDQGGTYQTAKTLVPTDDSQNAPISVMGIIANATDIDFFTLDVADQFGSSLDPVISNATAGTEMCVYVKCQHGSNGFSKCSGGTQSVGDNGDKGCCLTGVGLVTPQWNCDGSDDSAHLTIRIKASTAAAPSAVCMPYSFNYAF